MESHDNHRSVPRSTSSLQPAAMLPNPPHDWITPDWPAPARVRALCTTRRGGASAPPYDSLNLGLLTGDDPQAVSANWAAVQAALDAHGTPVHAVRLRQVHGARVVELDGATPH